MMKFQKQKCSSKHMLVSDNMSSAIYGVLAVFFISETKHKKATMARTKSTASEYISIY